MAYGNGLTGINWTQNSELEELGADGNRLPMSQLYPMMSLPRYYVGTQMDVVLPSIPSVPVPGVGYSLASETNLGPAGNQVTVFTLKRDLGAALDGIDYTITSEGILTFLERGEFEIDMRNPAVTKAWDTAELAEVVTSPIDVLPAGALLVWNGGSSAVWAETRTGPAGKDWLHSGYGVRYLETDDVVFGSGGGRSVAVGLPGVTPDAVSVEADGYVFSGGRIDGVTLRLSGPVGSSARFQNEISFSSGAEVAAGNELVFDYGPSSASTGMSVSGDGGVVKDGSGTLTLTGTHGYSGATRVLAGTLSAGPGSDISSSLRGGGLELHADAAFDVSGSGGNHPGGGLTVVGGERPAVIVAGSRAADFTGAVEGSITWIVPRTAGRGETLLRVVGEARLDADTRFRIVWPETPAGRPDMPLGGRIIFLEADTFSGSGFPPVKVTSSSGHVFTLEPDPAGGRLLAVLTALAPWTPSYERMKAYPEAAAASLAFASQGQDLLVGDGTASALAAAWGAGQAWGAFAAMAAGRSRYETGSSVDVSGASVLAGVAIGPRLGAGRLTLGVFMEAGKGDYDSANSFAGSAGVDGRGEAEYAGGGILARWDFGGWPLPGLYLEASVRTGRQETDFSTDDIRYGGASAAFTASGRYRGLHGGIGRKWRPGGPDGSFVLDLGARVLWTRQKGTEVAVNTDRVRFGDADSLRARIGGRIAHIPDTRFSPYMGAYFEREFDGDVRASVNGIPLETPTLRGDTAIFELGAIWKPSADGPLTLDFGVRGYAGRREGFSGSLTVKAEF
ncbi:MAG: autotransporter-associated beta strand repeat-containing protein [Deltaproteobacteria bacterium]|nr:autotransporter-associated beta strand repeat-containing protein [Deltaproteobacteria bacterium]